jgi:hypothetical protein
VGEPRLERQVVIAAAEEALVRVIVGVNEPGHDEPVGRVEERLARLAIEPIGDCVDARVADPDVRSSEGLVVPGDQTTADQHA